ncbi:PilZ domain-containing protein [Teredinibacter purpureus]|uniref:PilZ domain-containing protein n=1 Tax=Teredinibacter purpureus TaxID=2731756 RepID=UPI0005F86543|nr:PilZ domain-containing protein [Teredinibacter purpureus]
MHLVSRDYQEKRNFIRMKVETPITINLTSHDEAHQGVCIDLSGGGMLVEAPAAIPIGTIADVSIKSDHGHSPMLQARVVVRRVESRPDTKMHPCLLGMVITSVHTDG